MRTFLYLTAFAAVACVAFGQTANTAPHFEAVDVHPSSGTSPTSQFVRGPYLNGTRYDLRGATIVDLIVKAYDVTADKVVDGPNWLEYDRFDITALMPAKTSAADAKLMLQALLTDRFGLETRREDKPLLAYVLTTQKGKHKLKEATGSEESGCKPSINQARPPSPPAPGDQPAAAIRIAVPVITYACRNMTMAAFAEGMKGMLLAQQFIGTNPVADKTGLEGKWDFDMKYTLPIGDGDNISMQDALEKQLGLKLEQETTTLPVLVVTKVNRPTPNEPNVTQKIPPLPTEFEVATIRPFALPNNAGGPGVPIRIGIAPQPGGRVEINGLTLRMLIQQAWGVQNDAIVDAPKWMETDRYSIVAKMPGEDGQRATNTNIDPDYISGMVRKLLAERFKLAAHIEERSLPAYTLTAPKPKLKKAADPNARVKWIDTGSPILFNGSSVPSRTTKFQNMSMAQFAERLQFLAGTYFHSPVLDSTGLEGGYDFTLTYSPISPAMLAGLTAGRPAELGGANDPIGGVSLLDAVEKQLGLKLVEQKRPVQVLVIDHAEQQPTEN